MNEECQYEKIVREFYGLDADVSEKQEIKSDFGMLVNLVCFAAEQFKSEQKPGNIRTFEEIVDEDYRRDKSMRLAAEKIRLELKIKKVKTNNNE